MTATLKVLLPESTEHSIRSFSSGFSHALINFGVCGFLLCVGSIGSAQSSAVTNNEEYAAAYQELGKGQDTSVFFNSALDSFVGSRSCAASSCHGNPRRETVVGASAHYFFDRDKHQLAGNVLRTQRSREMAARFGLKSFPWEARECLVCHAPAAVDVPDPTIFSARLSEGVGCESCHGAARDWLVAHRDMQWKNGDVWSSPRKAESGFVDTSSLARRIDRCADCHVGNSVQSVNHDLIAAGHPRLAFEFAAYQSRMPTHWRKGNERLRTPVTGQPPSSHRSTYEATHWLLGQLINADHELQILEAAVERHDSATPELAQYDCFACHHQLSSPGWQRARITRSLHPGELPWGSWGLGLIAESQPCLPEILSDQFVTDLKSLRQTMSSLTQDQQNAVPIVQALRHQLASAKALLTNKTFAPEELSAIKNHLLVQNRSMTDQGWDSSTQLFLAMVAFEKGINDARGAGNVVTLDHVSHFERLRQLLSFKTEQDSVPTFRIPESPVNFERNWMDIQREFQDLQLLSRGLPRSISLDRADGDNIPPLPTRSVPETD